MKWPFMKTIWRTNFMLLGVITLLAVPRVNGQSAQPPVEWNQALSTVPATYAAPGFEQPGLQALFIQGEPWQGKETRIFAYYGEPAHAANERVPAMVLVHGGGGKAFPEWVRMWNAKGYAALAIDWTGMLPTGARFEYSCPPPADESFSQMAWNQKDIWNYHAVAAIIRANSLLRAKPAIDPDRIGVTGISWGGYLTCMAIGVDQRFKFAIPVYGCGFIYEAGWKAKIDNLPPDQKNHWIAWWDPSQYLPFAKMPILWVDGTNDAFYYLNDLAKSYHQPQGERQLAIRVRMPHSHEDGWAPAEIYAFADSFCKKSPPITRVTSQDWTGNQFRVTYAGSSPIIKAEINVTRDNNPAWSSRQWETLPAQVNQEKHEASATLDANVQACYINLYNQRGLLASSDYIQKK